jgi:hypothetical protein
VEKQDEKWDRVYWGKEEKNTTLYIGGGQPLGVCRPLEGASTSPLFMVVVTSLFMVVVTSPLKSYLTEWTFNSIKSHSSI